MTLSTVASSPAESGDLAPAGRRAGSLDTTMSTNSARPDKVDGTDLPNLSTEQTVFESLEEARVDGRLEWRGER